MGRVDRHRVSPRRGRAGRVDARALGHRHAHVGRCGASRAPYARIVLRLGTDARSGPVRLLHGAQFLPLVSVLGVEPDTGILPHQAVGRPKARPGGDSILHLHHGRVSGAADLVPRNLSRDGLNGLRAVGRDGRIRRIGSNGDGAPGRGDAVARHWRARRVRGEGAARAVPHVAARGVRRSAFACHHAADGRDVEDGRLRPVAHRDSALRRADCRHAHAAAGAGRDHRRDGRVGRRRAKGFEARLRVFVGESPGLLSARRFLRWPFPRRAQRRRPARLRRSMASSCRCSITASLRPPSSGSSP